MLRTIGSRGLSHLARGIGVSGGAIGSLSSGVSFSGSGLGWTRVAQNSVSMPAAGLRYFGAKTDPSNVLPEVKESAPGEMPSILDQATGLERGEIEHPDLFKHNEVLVGPFGTKENPVKIQSAFESRIVGCTGRAQPDDHDLVWMNVVKGEQIVCPECGQVFELDPL